MDSLYRCSEHPERNIQYRRRAEDRVRAADVRFNEVCNTVCQPAERRCGAEQIRVRVWEGSNFTDDDQGLGAGT